ncbi:LLM class flavin-dependent oxidoreductase [Nonomuraea ferruginea]
MWLSRTPRIGIGTGVALLPLHNPLAFAEQMSTLGALVGDRLHRVGVGMGGLDGDYAAMGVPRAEMRRRFADSLAVIRRLWAGETVTADVGSLRLAEARLYPRPSRPLPLAVGAMAEPSVRRAGLLGLPWITDPSHSLTTLERLAEIYWSAAGSEGEVILMRNAWLSRRPRDRADLVAACRALLGGVQRGRHVAERGAGRADRLVRLPRQAPLRPSGTAREGGVRGRGTARRGRGRHPPRLPHRPRS